MGCPCSQVTLVYLVPVEVTVDLDLGAVLHAYRSPALPTRLLRPATDEKTIMAQRIAEAEQWPEW
jgi:hypothetical protein